MRKRNNKNRVYDEMEMYTQKIVMETFTNIRHRINENDICGEISNRDMEQNA